MSVNNNLVVMTRSLLIWLFLILAPPQAFAADPTGSGMELLMVEEEGCMWCARWNRQIGPIYEKTSEGQRAPLRRIDKNAALPPTITTARGFFFTPTFILLVDGAEKGRIEGYPGEDFFWGLLAQMITSVDKATSANSERQHDNNSR